MRHWCPLQSAAADVAAPAHSEVRSIALAFKAARMADIPIEQEREFKLPITGLL